MPSPLSRRYWTATLAINIITEAQLLLLTFATGLQNAVALQFYCCFFSGQTGNIVKLVSNGIESIETHDQIRLILPGISLGSFSAGVFLTGQASRLSRERRQRGAQVAFGTIQTIMILAISCILVDAGSTESTSARISLGLLAFATASQIATARAWGIPEISTAMTTGAVVDLLNDERLFSRDNRSRNRRLLFLGTLAAGCAVGSVAMVWDMKEWKFAAMILASGVVKALVVVILIFSPEDHGDNLKEMAAFL